ncbi:MAG: hypothetical protein KDK70_39565, partial [Myxococcales bacterium]|nr:hypothetical protein [Myxococcales bacterium]
MPHDPSEASKSPRRARPGFHAARNGATRIDTFEELSRTALPAVRTFFRRLGAPQFVDEVLLPTLEEGDARIFCAVRDRPWPPWGLGARTITGLCEAHAVGPDSWALSPVYVLDEEATNLGLISAIYREVLEWLAVSATAEICYLAVEGSTLLDAVLRANGFRRHDDVLLTEHARYYTYRVKARELLERLGMRSKATPDLLAEDLPERELVDNATFHHTINLAGRADLLLDAVIPELVRLPRGSAAGKPGGVPSGTGSDQGTDITD